MTDHTDQLITRIVGDTPPAAAPPELLVEVMGAAAEMDRRWSFWRKWRRRSRGRALANFAAAARVDTNQTRQIFGGGALVRTKVLATVGALAVVAGVSFFVFGFPPSGDGTEATIGAAQRYQGKQLSAKDVQVPDSEVQQFIQSETFDRILKDPAARAALQEAFANPALRMQLGKPDVLEMMKQPQAFELMGRPEAAEVFANAGIVEALAKPGFALAFGKPGVVEALNQPAVIAALAKPGAIEALARTRNAEIADPALQRLQGNADIAMALAHPAMLAFARAGEANLNFMMDLISRPAALEMLGRPGLVQALAEPALQSYLARPAVLEAFKRPAMLEAMAAPAFGRVLAQDSLSAAVSPLFAITR